MADDIKCPKCGTTKYRNPSLRLMINVCGHGLCENCVEFLFSLGTGACPQCKAQLRRGDFRLQLFEDGLVEKEIDIRKKVLAAYNKKQDDFDSLGEYNDYLEEIEEIVFNLTNNVDVEETRRRFDTYKKDNRKLIERNVGRLSKEMAEIDDILEQERQELANRRLAIRTEEETADQLKKSIQNHLIDELMLSSRSAKDIVAQANEQKQQHQQETVKAKEHNDKKSVFSTGIQIGKGVSYVDRATVEEQPGFVFQYQAPAVELNGPPCPDQMLVSDDGYVQFVRATTTAECAGGFKADIACCRALQECFSGLFFKM